MEQQLPKAAVLCNGPSRSSFQSRIGYDLVLGCNIPWTDVDATVVLDEEVIKAWQKRLELIKCKVYYSRKAWDYFHRYKHERAFFMERSAGIVQVQPQYHSAGHVAVEKAINLGYKVIDIYGCDVMFADTIASYTRQHIPNNVRDDSKRHIQGWRDRWNKIIESHPEITLNFIK